MALVYIGVGSNIEPEVNIVAAVRALKDRARLSAVSTFYLTPALERTDAPPFYNGVLEVETKLPPRELKFGVLRAIEEGLGRMRTADKYAPRTIDLDIIVYDDAVLREPDLIVPDPDIESRAFVAVPLLELRPDLLLPDSGRRLGEAVETFGVTHMIPLAEFTRRLRQEIDTHES